MFEIGRVDESTILPRYFIYLWHFETFYRWAVNRVFWEVSKKKGHEVSCPSDRRICKLEPQEVML